MRIKNKKSGFSLVEIVLASTIFAIFSIGILYVSIDTIERDSKISLDTEAIFYAQEGLEAIRNMADRNYLNLQNGDHGIYLNEGSWSFIAAPETIDNFYSRTITIEDVYRNESGDIDAEGTVYDPDTKKITSEVAWVKNSVFPRNITLETYISNWKGDDWILSTCSEFNEGSYIDTESADMESPPEDNCGVQLAEIEDSSEFFSSLNLGKHATDVEVEGSYAYLATGSSSKGIAVANISNPSSPSIVDDLWIFNKGRYIKKSGNYAYVGVQSWLFGLAIVNVSNPSNIYFVSSWISGGYGNEAEVKDNYLYMAVEASNWGLWVYDATSKVLPSLIDIWNFDHQVKVTEINGDYLYVGLYDDHEGLKILDISDPHNIEEVAELDVGEEVNAIIISGITAFVGTEDANNSLKVLDIADPGNPEIITSLNVGGEIQDLVISGDYLYAAVDVTNGGLSTINISNPFSPSLAYNLDVQGKGTGIDADANYIYISTDTNNKGLVIVGATEEGVLTSGSYTSKVFDTGSADTRYNFIEWDHLEQAGGTIKFQIRTADTSAHLASATWVGIDGTNSTYYEIPRTVITLDPNKTGSRYFQFKAFFDSDGEESPTLENVRISYTP